MATPRPLAPFLELPVVAALTGAEQAHELASLLLSMPSWSSRRTSELAEPGCADT